MERTTREQVAERLRTAPATPATLAEEFGITPGAAVEHVRHLARSLDHRDGELQVAPPECRDCGFDGFDDPLNRPSRCPECRSEGIADPAFRIE